MCINYYGDGRSADDIVRDALSVPQAADPGPIIKEVGYYGPPFSFTEIFGDGSSPASSADDVVNDALTGPQTSIGLVLEDVGDQGTLTPYDVQLQLQTDPAKLIVLEISAILKMLFIWLAEFGNKLL